MIMIEHDGAHYCLDRFPINIVKHDWWYAIQDEAWEMQCVLLLWLSQLATLPFDLKLLDSRDQDPAAMAGYDIA